MFELPATCKGYHCVALREAAWCWWYQWFAWTV